MRIFPAYAGLNPTLDIANEDEQYIPRIRGVEPKRLFRSDEIFSYSPHTRG